MNKAPLCCCCVTLNWPAILVTRNVVFSSSSFNKERGMEKEERNDTTHIKERTELLDTSGRYPLLPSSSSSSSSFLFTISNKYKRGQEKEEEGRRDLGMCIHSMGEWWFSSEITWRPSERSFNFILVLSFVLNSPYDVESYSNYKKI